jgi:hypothetical protein
MGEWYRSGIEGYCKAAADVLGNRNDRKTVLGLCRDLFPDRKPGSNLSNAWQLSSERVGDRRCRQKTFECLWLSEVDIETYRSEAEALARGERPRDGFRTIVEGSSYEDALLACKGKSERLEAMRKQFEAQAPRAFVYIEEAEAFRLNHDLEKEGQTLEDEYRTIPAHSEYRERLANCESDEEAERTAIRQCEEDAIERCVQRVIDLYHDDTASNVSYLSLLMSTVDFPITFFNQVVPAIEIGLKSERNSPSEIQWFIQTLNGLIYRAHSCLADKAAHKDLAPFREFAKTLFAGLIYGPCNPLALGLAPEATPPIEAGNSRTYDGPESSTIRLTQVFDKSCAHTGYTELFRPSQVVFFGRSSDVATYLERCEEHFADDLETLAFVKSREPVIFPTVLHPAVGRWHGMLLCEDETWRYFDFDSTNGSSVISDEEVYDAKPLLEVRAGDYLRIGAPVHLDPLDSNAFMDAATLFVSSHVDLTEDLV